MSQRPLGLRLMPEEPKELTPEQKAEQETIARISAGVSAGVKAAIPGIVESIKPAEVPPPAPVRETPVQLARPTEEQIADAMVAGNKELLAKLLRDKDAYDRQQNQRAINDLTAQGGAAIGQSAKMLARQNLDHFRKYEKEIEDLVRPWASAGNMVTYETYERAHEIVLGRHSKELIAEATEEAIRKSREPAPELIPEGRRQQPQEPAEPKTLKDALAPDRYLFDGKLKAVGRSDDEELRKAGFKGFDDFMAQRKQNAVISEETNSGMFLDRDWACKAHSRKFCASCARNGAEGEYV